MATQLVGGDLDLARAILERISPSDGSDTIELDHCQDGSGNWHPFYHFDNGHESGDVWGFCDAVMLAHRYYQRLAQGDY